MGDQMDRVVTRREEQLYRILAITNVPPFTRPNHNVLFRNNGDGTFSDVSVAAGVHLPPERSLNAIFLDLDDDGWLDLYVLSDVAPNNFYHNNGDGTFTEWSKKVGLWDWRSSMGMAVGDPDADMDFDFYLGFFAAEPHALLENLMRMPGTDSTGPLRYASREETWGVKKDSYGYVGWGTSFTDWDRDGDLDLFLVAGHVSDVLEPPYRLGPQRNLLYVNVLREEGWARMVDVTDRAGPGLTDSLRASRGIALVDFDNDGDEDVSCTNMQDGVQLLRNDTPSPYHWLKVKLSGKAPNTQAVGALVTVHFDGFALRRSVHAGATFMGTAESDRVPIFGLGKATAVEKVVIRWPLGKVQEIPGERVVIDSTLVVEEG